MADPRTTPNPDLITERTHARVCVPIADLNRFAGAKRDRQVLLGERVTILGRTDTHYYVVTGKDDYVGYLDHTALGVDHKVTHRISTLASHIYTEANMKSPDIMALSHGSLVNVTEDFTNFSKTEQGYIPTQHLHPIDHAEDDFVEVAKLFLGTPYLWGGNSNTGVDCSGLVQAALTACGLKCPGDSDQQQAQLGHHLEPKSPIQKGDLFFWKGHIAIAADTNTLIHANAYHMACAYEPIDAAIARISAQGDGDLTAHKRL
jgi:cell wall-associated NlpC family hydrolase